MSSSFPEIPNELRQLMAELGPRWGSNPAAHVKIMVDQFSEVCSEGGRHRTGLPGSYPHTPGAPASSL